MVWHTSTGSGKESNVVYTWTLIGKKKQLTPPSVIPQKFWLDSANLVATECLEDMILIRLLFNPIIYAPCNHT